VLRPLPHRFDLRRSAQYFFIRALTAFFCAADIFERLRLGSRVSATARADFAMVRRAVLETVARSGNAFSKAAASVWSSFHRASAPRRAQVRMSSECFAIPPMLRRFAEGAQTWHHACSMTASIACLLFGVIIIRKHKRVGRDSGFPNPHVTLSVEVLQEKRCPASDNGYDQSMRVEYTTHPDEAADAIWRWTLQTAAGRRLKRRNVIVFASTSLFIAFVWNLHEGDTAPTAALIAGMIAMALTTLYALTYKSLGLRRVRRYVRNLYGQEAFPCSTELRTSGVCFSEKHLQGEWDWKALTGPIQACRHHWRRSWHKAASRSA
jgi:hypothetical protein